MDVPQFLANKVSDLSCETCDSLPSLSDTLAKGGMGFFKDSQEK